MPNSENILSTFTAFIEKSAAVMNSGKPPTQAAGGSTEQAGQTPQPGAAAGQPTPRVTETHSISTNPGPVLQPAKGIPTSNAEPVETDFNTFNK